MSHGVDRCFTWLPERQRTVIHNPLIAIEDDQATLGLPVAGVPQDRKYITAMGRLTFQKGFDLLLAAFQMVADKHQDWQLLILGEGELRPELENLRESLGMTDRVLLLGIIKCPSRVLRCSALFVMASRFEGFPYALLEAMACGLPVIYTDCPSGPREIIRNEIDGVLVPNGDVPSLAATMDRLMSDETERKRLAARAPEVAERFSLGKIIGIWEALLAQVAPLNARGRV